MARILQVCNTDFYLEKFLKPLVFELKRRGHDVECLCSGSAHSPEFAAKKIPVHDARFPAKASPSQFFSSIQHLRKFLEVNRFDCVNSHNRNASIVARVAAWRAGVPVRVYTAHGMYFHDGQGKLGNILTETFEGWLARITTFTLSQSDEDTKRMVRRGWISSDRILTIGNGINTGKFSPEKTAAAAPTEIFRVGALGRLVAGKGFEDLVRAFHSFQKEVPASELLFIGGNIDADLDSSAASMKQLIDELGLAGKVRVTGIVNNVEDYLGTCDVFVHPSYREGMPRSLLEAMCMGMPVIATSIRGAREIVKQSDNGFLFEPRDSAGIAELLRRVHGMSRPERLAMGQRARDLVLKNFDEKVYVSKQADSIEGLLQNSRRQS